jgi:hypothetical protein
MAAESKSYSGLMHAGAGTGLLLVQVSAIIPGLLPTLGLLGVVAAVLLLPVVALGLAVAILAAPALGAWVLVSRIRARRARTRPPPRRRPPVALTRAGEHAGPGAAKPALD